MTDNIYTVYKTSYDRSKYLKLNPLRKTFKDLGFDYSLI